MTLLFRAALVGGALALSGAALAGNDEGNKPLNNVAVTEPHPIMTENRAAAEDQAAPQMRRAQKRHGGATGMDSAQPVNSQGGD
jgi:hypothetical protein